MATIKQVPSNDPWLVMEVLSVHQNTGQLTLAARLVDLSELSISSCC
jgi:hypothetical protein